MKRSTLLEKLIIGFPQQLKLGLHAARSARAPSPLYPLPSPLVIAGMGGSALPGLLLESLASRAFRREIPVVVHRDYALPSLLSATSRPLVICISYSGTTEETLSAYREARKRHLPVMVITSGGTLAKQAEHDHVPLALIPGGAPPRFAVGYQFGALISLLVKAHLLPATTETHLARTAQMLRPNILRARAKRIARRLKNRTPVIYASNANSALAYIWKIQFNENVKIPAFAHVFPELNHNELQSYARLTQAQSALRKSLAAVILEDPDDADQIKKRMRITASLITKSGVPCERILLPGRTLIVRSLNALLLAEWTALALAQSYNVDPLPVALVEDFKTRLRR